MVDVTKEQRKLFIECWDTWGGVAQVNQAIEECAEFIAAVNKFRRGRITIDEVTSEIADVLLCMNQLNTLFEDYIDDEYNFKIERLETRLKEWKLENKIEVEK